MTEASSHIIRHTQARVRVLRTAVIDGQICFHEHLAPRGRGRCQACGCTDAYGCIGGCAWWDTTHRLCSRCAGGLDDE